MSFVLGWFLVLDVCHFRRRSVTIFPVSTSASGSVIGVLESMLCDGLKETDSVSWDITNEVFEGIDSVACCPLWRFYTGHPVA
jgi:hypothetical protein